MNRFIEVTPCQEAQEAGLLSVLVAVDTIVAINKTKNGVFITIDGAKDPLHVEEEYEELVSMLMYQGMN